MTAQERERKRGTAQSPQVVPMHELLASCAAADAVSKPPSAPEAEQDVPRVPGAQDGEEPHQERDAA
ncbi:hypothetical protein [Streptomyces sp. HNM0574]|uniref:hypothetical protein n=1 Tax=Streptomyces sp. HNM0574 TaxID=2714954 RepID=UPI00146E5824|nr:hypothetical protein [Streptomyces sp. HNM0574]NLU66901.1 hypothetical protein [Streptomyces sp. HNM0574]